MMETDQTQVDKLDETKGEPKQALSLDDSETKSEVKSLQIITKSGKIFVVSHTACQGSSLLKGVIEDPEAKSITFDRFDHDGATGLIVDWLHRHYDKHEPVPVIAKPLKNADLTEDLYGTDTGLVKELVKDQDLMFMLVLQSNYLQIQPLLIVGCAAVASLIKGRTPAEIRKVFNIRDDYTPEEEEQIRKEHADLLN